jgi:diguanylate cyclase (GGDEF)-like protein/PAS domain S-box-containing protein
VNGEAQRLLDVEGWQDSAIPALCFDANGDAVAMNAAARSVVDCTPALLDAVADIAMAARQGGPRSETVTLSDVGASPVVIDVLAMTRPAEGVVLVGLRDRTLETNLREALVDSRRRFRDLVNISGAFAWELDAAGTLTFVSQRGALGYKADDLWGKAITDLIPNHDPDVRMAFMAPVMVESVEVQLRHADGSVVPHLVSTVPLFAADGQWCGARGVCRDIGEERQRDRELARVLHRERVVARVLRTFRGEVDPVRALVKAVEVIAKGITADCCTVVAATPSLTADKPTFETLAGHGDCGGHTAMQQVLAYYDPNATTVIEVEGWQVLAAPTWCRDMINGLLVAWRLDGSAPWSEEDLGLANIFSLQVGTAIEQVHQHRRLMAIASTDPLTGLLNRRGFESEAKRHFSRLQRSGRQAVLMYVDLDNFKAVNDTHGHATGDEALVFVRDLLKNNIRPTDLVARVGGDEFVLWLDGAGQTVAERCARVLITASAALRRFSGSPAQPLGMSIGAVIYDPRSAESFPDLIARADRVMYQVKRDGKGGFAIAPPLLGGDAG